MGQLELAPSNAYKRDARRRRQAGIAILIARRQNHGRAATFGTHSVAGGDFCGEPAIYRNGIVALARFIFNMTSGHPRVYSSGFLPLFLSVVFYGRVVGLW